jgi:hypothetical protein
MERLTIELPTLDAKRIIEDLARLQVIHIIPPSIVAEGDAPNVSDKRTFSERFRGSISPENRESLVAHIKEIRGEWRDTF